ncbi:MAG: hypothetical protein ACXABI_05520 [Candidatus Hodarchaeales archaeon]
MIVINDLNGNPLSIPLVDFHTHIGKVTIATTKGKSQRINQPNDIINLYQKLQYELYARIKKNQDSCVFQLPDVKNLAKPLYPFAKSILSINENKKRGWLVDKIVTFPFNDIFHTQTNPKFIKSNRYVRHQVHTFDHSLRFNPFCRVDPTDSNSTDEVINSVDSGMSGLKLHPLSQGWIKQILSTETKEILRIAGDLKLPVIFDVPNEGVAVDITTVTQETRSENENPVNVILGHSGFDYSSSKIFECLALDGMYAETSGMRGKDVKIFFENLMSVPNWEQKILFGTDHNYFSVLQAADLIEFLFSEKFQSMLEENSHPMDSFAIASQILGLNALRIIPKKWRVQSDNSQSTDYSIPINDFYEKVRKFITTKDNFIKLEFGEKSRKKHLYQIFSFGSRNLIQSFAITLQKDLKKIVLHNVDDKYILPVLTPESILSLKYIEKRSTKTVPLSQDGLNSLITKKSMKE